MSSIAHYHCRLALPFIVEEVNRILDYRRVAPIVLGKDEDECGILLDLLAPRTSVRLGVIVVVVDLSGDDALIEEGEIPLGQIDDLEFGWRFVTLGFDSEWSGFSLFYSVKNEVRNVRTYSWLS